MLLCGLPTLPTPFSHGFICLSIRDTPYGKFRTSPKYFVVSTSFNDVGSISIKNN